MLRSAVYEYSLFWAFPPTPGVVSLLMWWVKYYFIVILIYIFLSACEVEHHFTCLLAICISFSLNSIFIFIPPTPPLFIVLLGCFSFHFRIFLYIGLLQICPYPQFCFCTLFFALFRCLSIKFKDFYGVRDVYHFFIVFRFPFHPWSREVYTPISYVHVYMQICLYKYT